MWRENTDASKVKDFEDLMQKYGSIKGSLITILQGVQGIFGYLPREVMEEVASRTGSTIAKVLGVATFYTQFRFQPVGKYLIMVCKGTACHVNGSEMVIRTIKDELGIGDGETTKDGLFSVVQVACLGCCSLSPVMMINDNAYGSLTPQKIKAVFDEIRQKEKV